MNIAEFGCADFAPRAEIFDCRRPRPAFKMGILGPQSCRVGGEQEVTVCVTIIVARVVVVLLASASTPSRAVAAEDRPSRLPAGGFVQPGQPGIGARDSGGLPATREPRELAERSARLAEEAYNAAQEGYRAGRTDVESVFRWSSRWMEEQVAAAPPLARRQAAESHLARMLALEEAVMARRTAGASISKLDEAAVRYYVAEARRQVATIVRVAPPVRAPMGAPPSIREEADPKEAVPPAAGGMPPPAPGKPVRKPSSSSGDVVLPESPGQVLRPGASKEEALFTRPPGQPLAGDNPVGNPQMARRRTVRPTERDLAAMYEQLTVQKLEETLAKLQQDITIAGERHRAAFAAHQQAADAYNAVRGELKVAALLRKLKAQAAEQREAEACAKIQSEFSAACVAYLRRLNPE